jgi:hypothetical protein
MNGNYLLDTNIAIAFLENEAAVVTAIREATNVWLPSIALGELCYGARKSGRPQHNLSHVQALAEQLAIVSAGRRPPGITARSTSSCAPRAVPSPITICGLRRLPKNTVSRYGPATTTLQKFQTCD